MPEDNTTYLALKSVHLVRSVERWADSVLNLGNKRPKASIEWCPATLSPIKTGMAQKFTGPHETLQALVATAGFRGKWSAEGQGKLTFRGEDGCVLNWWPSRGTVQIQGAGRAKQLARVFESNEIEEQFAQMERARDRRQIFIVHGHDSVSRDQLELALRRLGVEPFVLMNSSGGGNILIEALEGAIGRDYSSDFGIVLMTPDDMGYATKDGPDKVSHRARQNVVLETGMLLSSLTRKRMAIVVKAA